MALGYHGTSELAARAILNEGFHSSDNDYDWLGRGIYFWQDGRARAWEWATQQHGQNGAVIGAVIHLEDCIDLLDIGWEGVIGSAYRIMRANYRATHQLLPVQRGGAHRRDCAVINNAVRSYASQGKMIRSVRSAFQEGRPMYYRSSLFDRSHVQIAVRDQSVITERWQDDGKEVPLR
jgi:hypothetical protein